MLLLKLLKISTCGQQGYGKFIPTLKTFSALTHKLFHAAAAPFAISIKFIIEEVMDGLLYQRVRFRKFRFLFDWFRLSLKHTASYWFVCSLNKNCMNENIWSSTYTSKHWSTPRENEPYLFLCMPCIVM